ncbi:phage tail tube protein [Sphingomicrobium sp. XHP0239]|uniref:phage tail tube protein n=1 Tax=Sphingomicrobium maritimum TaxID=3133972 RepID=UPI0031CC5E8A
MTTEARIGWGAEFHLDDDGDTLTEIGEVTNITPPNPQTEDVEATHLKSPNRRKEYIAGLIEDGEGTFELNLVPGSDSDTLIQTAQNDGVARDYKIVIPDGAFGWEITGTCYVKGYDRGNITAGEKMTATVTLRFTGDKTEAAATS